MKTRQKLEEKEVTIGRFHLLQKTDFGDEFWIYQDTGEGMGLNEDLVKKLEKVIEEFYIKYF